MNLSKNNLSERQRRNLQKITKYGIRKLSIGAASVALSSLFFLMLEQFRLKKSDHH